MHNIMYVDITMFCVFLVQFGWSVERVLVLFFFSLYGDHRDLHVLTHSFPTRRSSDLDARNTTPQGVVSSTTLIAYPTNAVTSFPAFATAVAPRSEEHTSDLQSLMRFSYAVFCLKKKTHHIKPDNLRRGDAQVRPASLTTFCHKHRP